MAGLQRKFSSFLLVLTFVTSLLSVASPTLAQLGASFTPPHSDTAEDTDGDNLYNHLVVSVSLNVTTEGVYHLIGGLYDATGAIYITSAGESPTLTAGAQTVQLRFSGLDIRRSGIDGSYLVHLWLYQERIENMAPVSDTYTTKAYSHTQFQTPAAAFSPPHSDDGLDVDGDNFYDHLVVNVGLTVSTAGKYYVSGSLHSGATYITCGYIENYLTVGAHVLPMNFDGSAIRRSALDGPYTVYLSLSRTDPWEWLESDTHTTKAYSYTQFQRPAVVFAPPHSEEAKDTDGDNLYNYLIIKVRVNVNKAGRYCLSGSLSSMVEPPYYENMPLPREVPPEAYEKARYYQGYPIDHAWKEVDLPKGPEQVVELSFSGERIHQSKVDGPYVVNLSIYPFWDPTAYEERYWSGWIGDSGTYTTKAYSHTQFQTPAAAFSPPHSDYGEDTDGDGKYDYLTVEVRLEVTKTGRYQICGSLTSRYVYGYPAAGPGGLYAWAHTEQVLEAGTRTVKLQFEGSCIRQSRVNGPYEAHFSLMDTDWNWLGSDTHTTKAYTYTDFTDPPIELLPPHVDRVRDVDGDGKYNYLEVDVKLKVNAAGTYYIFGTMAGPHAENAMMGVLATKKADLTGGERTVTLRFLGGAINKLEMNGPYHVHIMVSSNLDFMTKPLAVGYHRTTAYRYTDFEFPPIELLPEIRDYGEDTNNDGKYDYLTVEARVNVRKAGKYALLAAASPPHREPLDWKLVEQDFSIGGHSVKIRFEGWKFRAAGDGHYQVSLLLLDPSEEQVWFEFQGISTPITGWLQFRMYQTGL